MPVPMMKVKGGVTMATKPDAIDSVTESNLSKKIHSISFWVGIFSVVGAVVRSLVPGLTSGQVKTLESAAAVIVALILSGSAVAVVHAVNAAKLKEQELRNQQKS